MLFRFNTNILFHATPVDYRKQIDGLSILAADQLRLDPTFGQLFLLQNRLANKIEILWYDKNGFWIFYKR